MQEIVVKVEGCVVVSVDGLPNDYQLVVKYYDDKTKQLTGTASFAALPPRKTLSELPPGARFTLNEVVYVIVEDKEPMIDTVTACRLRDGRLLPLTDSLEIIAEGDGFRAIPKG